MFTLIEVTDPEGFNAISLALNVLADLIFMGALYWSCRGPTDDR